MHKLFSRTIASDGNEDSLTPCLQGPVLEAPR